MNSMKIFAAAAVLLAGASVVLAQSQGASYGTFNGISESETSIYNLALDEMQQNIEEDGTFRTGKLWGGVWTRDVSYASMLSLAHIRPDIVMKCLMVKVDKLGRIIQDTGTGGSWPCSTDRVVWNLAAWEVFLETGDMDWLQQAYDITAKSLNADFVVAFDPKNGLFNGESSFIDWRKQSYPLWMQPADIAASQCLGTNAVYCGVLKTMARMATALGKTDEAAVYSGKADALAKAIRDNFWMDDKGWFASYLYGREYQYSSGRSESLGESLCILFDIATPDQADRILSNMPICKYGPTIFWPMISDMRSYHNDAIWPFVTSFYGFAAASRLHYAGVECALNSNRYVAVTFGSCQENLVASDGSMKTAKNSPRQLWSIGGMMGMYRTVLLGAKYSEDGIRFSPCVPPAFDGKRSISGMKYRNMCLDVTVQGCGSRIKSVRIDGEKVAEAFIPADETGSHTVEIILAGVKDRTKVNLMEVEWDLNAPQAKIEGDNMMWKPVKNAETYIISCNGVQIGNTAETTFALTEPGEYTVIARGTGHADSFISEPVLYKPYAQETSCTAFLTARNKETLSVTVDVPEDGDYFTQFRYSNGNGEIETNNKCCNRMLIVDGEDAGVVVMPQRGKSWSLAGLTQPRPVYLTAGKHTIELRFTPENTNMNITDDEALVYSVVLTRK